MENSEKKDQEREEFLKTIYSIPIWVKTEKDWIKYSAHLHYRLIQSRASLEFLEKEMSKHIPKEVLEKIFNEDMKIYGKFQDWKVSYSKEDLIDMAGKYERTDC